jgi:hypothetical protein
MGMEKLEILEMLKEGKIEVADAARLLDALEDGMKKRGSRGEGDSSKKHAAVQDAMNSVKETLAGIGPLVGRMVGEISTEFQRDRNFPGESEGEELPEMEAPENRFRIEAGQKLFIRNDKQEGPGGGDVYIEGIDGGTCEFEGDEAKNLRVLRSSSGPVIRWSGGTLKIKVPATVEELLAYTLGGDLQVGKLGCPARLKSMGGDLRLTSPSRHFHAKTMGGNIRLRLGPEFCEPSEAKTMGGNIRVDVADGLPITETEAVTMGGSIMVSDELGRVRKGGNLGKQKINITLGDGQPGSRLKVKTMGGNIEIGRARDVN